MDTKFKFQITNDTVSEINLQQEKKRGKKKYNPAIGPMKNTNQSPGK